MKITVESKSGILDYECEAGDNLLYAGLAVPAIAGVLGLPELFVINIDGQPFPLVWAIIGSALFALLAGLVTRRRAVTY